MRPNVDPFGSSMAWGTHDSIFMAFGRIGDLVISTELYRNASMRPNVDSFGLSMPWGTHTSIFMAFGGTVDFSYFYWTLSQRVYATKCGWHWIAHGLGHLRFDFHGVRWNRNFGKKTLVATERDVLTENWWYHRDQHVEYPLWGDYGEKCLRTSVQTGRLASWQTERL